MRLSGARTVACVWSYTGRAQKYPVRPSASTVTRMATNAMTPLRRRGGAGAAELTIVAGTSVRERSPAAPGNGRPATAAAIRAGGTGAAGAGTGVAARPSGGRYVPGTGATAAAAGAPDARTSPAARISPVAGSAS